MAKRSSADAQSSSGVRRSARSCPAGDPASQPAAAPEALAAKGSVVKSTSSKSRAAKAPPSKEDPKKEEAAKAPPKTKAPSSKENLKTVEAAKGVTKGKKRKADDAVAAAFADPAKNPEASSAASPATKQRAKGPSPASPSVGAEANPTLPRLREHALMMSSTSGAPLVVLGLDEAGRGPLAGPVVCGCISLPYPPSSLNPPPPPVLGVTDSKAILSEDSRASLYSSLVTVPGVRWSVAVVSAARIDAINILEATMEGMRAAANHVTGRPNPLFPLRERASKEMEGCYVVGNCGETVTAEPAATAAKRGKKGGASKSEAPATSSGGGSTTQYYALVDGNRYPNLRSGCNPLVSLGPDMPCPGEAMVAGDGREYVIAAASILAKVTRDKLMREYDEIYPEFNLKQHKGYPTRDHMMAVWKHGASKIHRRTFAPLKGMSFDEAGKPIGKKSAVE